MPPSALAGRITAWRTLISSGLTARSGIRRCSGRRLLALVWPANPFSIASIGGTTPQMSKQQCERALESASGAAHFNIDNAPGRRKLRICEVLAPSHLRRAVRGAGLLLHEPTAGSTFNEFLSRQCPRGGGDLQEARRRSVCCRNSAHDDCLQRPHLSRPEYPLPRQCQSASLVGRASTLQTSRTQRAAPFSSPWTSVRCRSSPCETLERRPGRRRASCGRPRSLEARRARWEASSIVATHRHQPPGPGRRG